MSQICLTTRKEVEVIEKHKRSSLDLKGGKASGGHFR